MMGSDEEIPDTVRVCAWSDPVVERCGFPVNSVYVESAWLPILGPSATLALRRLGLLATAAPEGVEVNLGQLAGDLGIGKGTGRNSVIVRTVRRLCSFGMAQWRGGELAVRTAVAPLPTRYADRLSPSAGAVHRQMVRMRTAPTDRTEQPRRSLSR